MVILLLVAGGTYFALGDVFDAIIVLVALVPIVAVGLLLEARAEHALEKLKRLTAPTTPVRRDDELVVIPAEEIVPSDLVSLQEGDIVPADGSLIEASQNMLDEAALNGESLPLAKDPSGTTAERQVLAGTTVVSGRGVYRVTSAGLKTQ